MTDSPVIERCRWQARVGAHARHLRACQDCQGGYACLAGDAALAAIQKAYARYVAARDWEVASVIVARPATGAAPAAPRAANPDRLSP